MTQEAMMQIDAALLMFASLACGILLCADKAHRPILPTLFTGMLGVAMFLQAIWLLGVWWPRPGGYPLPRLTADAALAAYLAWRVVPVVIERWREDCRMKQIRRRRAAARR